MEWLVVGSMGLAGLVAGSFIAAASIRLPRNESVVFGRSHCMSCQRSLAPFHLIPVFSWLALRGRCGWCAAPISSRYVLIELAGAGMGVWAAAAGMDWLLITATAVLGWLLLLIAVVDAEHHWLPDQLTFPLIISGLVVAGYLARGVPWSQLIGALAGFGSLWLLKVVYRALRGRDGLGGGDPIMFAGAGAWIGWIGLPGVLLWACLAGFCIVLSRAILGSTVQMTDRLPFGAFLAFGIWTTWMWGMPGR